MDAQFHLNKFTKMSADTIVGILENLADVTDREDSYTLTLGTTNLDKLTEEQKSILNQYANTTPVNARSSKDSAGGFSFGDHKKKKGFKKGL